MCEQLAGSDKDSRGWWVNGNVHSVFVCVTTTPNSSSPDILYPDPSVCSNNDGITDDPVNNLPCDPASSASNYALHYTASRSRHRGGVHVLLADGAVRMISDNISLTTLQNLAFKKDGQVVGEF